MTIDGVIDGATLSNGTNYAYPYNNGFGDFGGIWGLLAIAIIFGGWGGNGFGFGGNNHTYQATNDIESSLHNALDTLQITNKLDGITTDLNTDFGNVINAITTNGYENRLAMNDLGFNMQNCCCSIQRNIDQTNYNIAQSTAAINATTTAQTQKILDALAQNKIDALQNKVNQLELQNAVAGVVRYPTATTYTSGNNPFCGCGCGNNNI